MHFMGIDPGKTGGVVVLKDKHLVYAAGFDANDPLFVLERAFANFPNSLVGLEDVHAMPGQGVVSMFTFGTGYGEIRGFLRGTQTPYRLIRPQAWQGGLPEHPEPKKRVRQWVEERFTESPFIFEGRRVPHQGCMDAAGIADYLRRVECGELTPPVVKPKKTKLRPMKL